MLEVTTNFSKCKCPTFGGSLEADGVGDSSAKGGIELICPKVIEHQAITGEKTSKEIHRIRIYNEALAFYPFNSCVLWRSNSLTRTGCRILKSSSLTRFSDD